MPAISIPFLNEIHKDTSVQTVSELLHHQEKHFIRHAPWPAYPYMPAVSFAMAYGINSLLLQYEVAEKEVRAVYTQPNDPVYKDSCVEFFVSFDEKGYYNFEFNCIGTCLAAFGPGRSERTFLPIAAIEKIKSLSHICRGGSRSGDVHWQLTMMLPFDAFIHHSLTDLKNKKARANFYKCGDETQQPHYLCWNNIQAPKPDFHLPQFFGTLQFAP